MRRWKLVGHFTFIAAFLAGCVSLEQLPPGSVPGAGTTTSGSSAAPGTFPDLDPGATSVDTNHFTVKAYNEYDARPISVMAENLYNKIGADTGLYSYMASGRYTLVVYKNREEYATKTRLPQWSRAVTTNGQIYMYPGEDLEPVLAHEMTHLIFNSYMGDAAKSLRWINEGLAMYEEVSKMSDGDRSKFQSALITDLRPNKMGFSQMTFFTPATEQARRVDVWYMQVYSVISFLLTQGSALNFANMLGELRNGTSSVDVDKAISDNYPGKFRTLGEVENAWKFTV